MNLEKFTDRAKGFLQSAQTVAIRMNHQRITPEHVLKALLEDNEGMAAGLIARAGGNVGVAQAGVDVGPGEQPRQHEGLGHRGVLVLVEEHHLEPAPLERPDLGVLLYQSRYEKAKQQMKEMHWNATDGIWYDYDIERKVSCIGN